MKTLLTLVVGAAFILSLTGCGIIGGAGQDISSAGHVVTKSANAVKRTISY
ncbi:MAG: entericidin [bacterium]